MMNARIFSGLFPHGIAYSDRGREVAGDYARLAFLSYHTLELSVEMDCPADLEVEIRRDAAGYQARKGELLRVSTCGQTVLLGSEL